MLSRIGIMALGLMVFAASAAIAQDLTLEQILKKNEEALGGAEAISKVQTLRITGRTAAGEMEMQMTTSAKRPNLVRNDMTIMGYDAVSAYDGTTAWMVNGATGSTEPQKLEGSAAGNLINSRLESAIGVLAAMQAAGDSIELLGKEDVSGASSYKLKVKLKAGFESTYFLDATTFLPVKIIAKMPIMGQEMIGETYPKNYQKVGGILFAHTLEMNVNGQTLRVTYDKVEVNAPMEDSIFKMPVKEAPPVKKLKTAP
jgi:outer membrane lipoprotein-sorting protein